MLAVSLVTGCFPEVDPDDLEYFEVFNSAGDSHFSPLVPGRSVGADPARLDGIASDMVRAEYSISPQRRPFLLEENLAEGIMAGDYLHLPQEAPDEIFRTELIADPTKWNSFRVYDAGLCSLHAPWELFADRFINGFASNWAASTAIEDGELLQASVTGVIRAEPGAGSPDLTTDADSIRANIVLHAGELSLTGGTGFFGFVLDLFQAECSNVTFDVSFEFSQRPTEQPILITPPIGFDLPPGWPVDECPPGPGGVFIMAPDGFTQDIAGEVNDVSVSVSGCGVANGEVASGFEQALRESLPSSVRAGLLDNLLFRARDLGIPPDMVRPCACDNQCNIFAEGGPAYPGKRHRCVVSQLIPEVVGECYVQLEPDRVNVQPRWRQHRHDWIARRSPSRVRVHRPGR